jgi:hypothetical protein
MDSDFFDTAYRVYFACFVVAFIVATCTFARAQYGVQADVTFASQHYIEGEFTEANPGLFLTGTRLLTGAGKIGVGVGAYRNSFGKLSGAVAARWTLILHPWLRFGGSLGFVSGYSDLGVSRGPVGLVPLVTQSIRAGPPEMQLLILHLGGGVGFGVSFNNLTE